MIHIDTLPKLLSVRISQPDTSVCLLLAGGLYLSIETSKNLRRIVGNDIVLPVVLCDRLDAGDIVDLDAIRLRQDLKNRWYLLVSMIDSGYSASINHTTGTLRGYLTPCASQALDDLRETLAAQQYVTRRYVDSFSERTVGVMP